MMTLLLGLSPSLFVSDIVPVERLTPGDSHTSRLDHRRQRPPHYPFAREQHGLCFTPSTSPPPRLNNPVPYSLSQSPALRTCPFLRLPGSVAASRGTVKAKVFPPSTGSAQALPPQALVIERTI